MVTVGSIWKDSEYTNYVVINLVTINGKDWVFYRKEKAVPENENREFSCYVESFVRRFTPYDNY